MFIVLYHAIEIKREKQECDAFLLFSLDFEKILMQEPSFQSMPPQRHSDRSNGIFLSCDKPVPVRPAEKGRCHPTNPWLPSNRLPHSYLPITSRRISFADVSALFESSVPEIICAILSKCCASLRSTAFVDVRPFAIVFTI